MKTLGLLGGMSWESTVLYYQEINRRVRDVKGGLYSAPCVIYSFDFHEIKELQHAGEWETARALLEEAAAKLHAAGAEAIVLCTNTMHLIVQGIENAARLPLIHIVDPTAEHIVQAGFQTVGLLGTRFTMEEDFYKKRLADKWKLRVVIPDEKRRTAVHSIIYTELCNGIVREESRQVYQDTIRDLAKQGAQCVILGCTEIVMLIRQEDSELPVFDTTKIHAIAAADWAMGMKVKEKVKDVE